MKEHRIPQYAEPHPGFLIRKKAMALYLPKRKGSHLIGSLRRKQAA
jgi:hypothetical protein